MKARLQPGTLFRLTGKFLRSTGQERGGEGMSKWTVQPCTCAPCERGDWVMSDEWDADYDCFRHFARGNIEKVGN